MYRHLYICVLLPVILAACSAPLGYAVLLWSPDEAAFATGSIVPVQSESQIRQEYTLQNTRKDPALTVEMWRVRFFKRIDDAESFSRHYAPFAALTGQSQRIGLPVREEMNNLSAIVYRLADGELVKILERSSEKIDLAGFYDHWYRVLTADGTTGWIFGYYLSVLGGDVPLAEEDFLRDGVALITSQVWRPEYFREMIDTQHIDLDRFSEDYGFFFNPEEHSFHLVLPELRKDFIYTELVEMGPDTLNAMDSGLEIQLRDEHTLLLQFRHRKRIHNQILIAEDFDIAKIREQEQQRRQALLQRMLDEAGSAYRSEIYGELRIEEDASFLWTGYERLVPSIVQPNAGNIGTLHFEVFPSKELAPLPGGIITFRFSALSQQIHFLYTFTDEGMRLTYLSPETIEDHTLVVLPSRPFVIFFRTTD